MITTALNVERHYIHAEALALLFEQMIGHLYKVDHVEL
jgi:hypothetical protein